MRRFVAPRSGNVSAVTAAFCALLVLLPGVCSAATSTLTPHGGGDDSLHGRGGAGSHHRSTHVAHSHGAADTAEPTSHHAPEQDAEHCDPHGCCVAAVKSSTRQQSIPPPATIDFFDLGITFRPVAALDGQDIGRSAGPPGTPGLKANNVPLLH